MAESKKTMWGGRFAENPDDFMVEFGASIDVDIELLDVDIDGSVAWVKALGKAQLLTETEATAIIDGLDGVCTDLRARIADGSFVPDRTLEDVHMTVESMLIDRIGETGAKLHTGRSRNDQVALDERLYLKRAIPFLADRIAGCQQAIVEKAKHHVEDIVPSYTHLQQAQPVRLAHYLLAWFWMLERDRGRLNDCLERVDVLPLGSGAVAGSGFPVDRAYLAQLLGFSKISENSIDAVSDRDFMIELVSGISITMMHLSRIAEDLIIWSTAEFGFVCLSDRYSTGSSMMPQKKNPDSLELVRGKTGRVYGDLVSLLTVLKGIPFSYAKDMQEDKEPVFDAISTLDGCLRIVRGVIEEMTFVSERMLGSFDDAVFATDVADYLTAKGMPFRSAHAVAGSLVRWSVENCTPMRSIPLSVFRDFSPLFDEDVFYLFDLVKSADRRSLDGGTGREALGKQLKKAISILMRESGDEPQN